MNRLKRVRVSGFKSIREMDLELGSINVLIGANGAGKSNLASLFGMLSYAMSGSLQIWVGENGWADSILHFGAARTPRMTVDLEYETDRGDNLYHARLVHAAADALMFADEAVAFTPDGQGGLPEPVSLGSGHKESAVPEAGKAGNRTAAAAFGCMSKWRFYQFHDTSATSGMRATHYIHDNRYLRSDAGNLAAYLHLLREMEPRHYAVIVDTIRLAAPFFDDFELGPLELNTERVVLGWRERESGHRFGPHQLSDGTLRFIALCTLLLQPGERRPEIMVIDEPELGLHPHAISLLGSMVRSASHDRQILLATQSVDLVNEFEPESIVVVDHHAGESSFTRLRTEDLADWLEDYSIGELWEKNVLGGRPSH